MISRISILLLFGDTELEKVSFDGLNAIRVFNFVIQHYLILFYIHKSIRICYRGFPDLLII